MLLWISCAVLSAAVLAFVLRPVWAALRPSQTIDQTAVYRDQLAAIDADLDRGLIAPAEAEGARTEIARRLLAASSTSGSDGTASARSGAVAVGPQRSAPAWLGSVLAAGVPLLAISLYLAVGSPSLPDQPLSARVKAQPPPDPSQLIAAVEARLATNPDDGRGWDVIAPVYYRQGQYAKAGDAYIRAIRLLGESPPRLAGLAESTVLASDGQVTEVAREAFTKLAALEPQRLEPRFWLALGKEQSGRLAEAAADYRALLAEAAGEAQWRQLLTERLSAVEGQQVASSASSPPPDPTAKSLPSTTSPQPPAAGPASTDMAAAERLPPSERQQMIEALVQSLADRLRADGRDLAGWQRLIRAYAILGRKEEALAALGHARRNFTTEPTSLASLADLARQLGLET